MGAPAYKPIAPEQRKNHIRSASIVVPLILIQAVAAECATLIVGPEEAYSSPSLAAGSANDGDVVLIQPGNYQGDVAVWTQDNLTIRALGGGAHIQWLSRSAEGKALWVIKGNDVEIDNVEFSGARVLDRNGAGIRHEGRNLTIRNCRFHDNENGILSGRTGGSLVIESSVFYRNGYGDGRSHSLYVGHADHLIVRGSLFYHANVGHHIKTRARRNEILYNKILDKETGNSSYLIDFPEGGDAVLIGNVLQQGRRAENRSLVSFAAENKDHVGGRLAVINNTFVNDRNNGLFLSIATTDASVHVQNNIFFGRARVSNRAVNEVANLVYVPSRDNKRQPIFVDRANFDFQLTPGSPAIDAGVDPVQTDYERYTPRFEHHDVATLSRRHVDDRIDQGAFEFGGNTR